MKAERQKLRTPHSHAIPRNTWGVLSLVGLVELATTGMLIFCPGKRMVRQYAHFAATAEKIRSDAALGHLWFEEAIAGDINQSFEKGEERLKDAEALTRGMLHGNARHIAVKDTKMARDLDHVLEQ